MTTMPQNPGGKKMTSQQHRDMNSLNTDYRWKIYHAHHGEEMNLLNRHRLQI